MLSTKQLTALILLVVTAIGGLVFSGLLFYSSAQVSAGVTGSTLCQIGSNFDCAPALSSPYASLLGVPLPVISGAFYFAVLALALTVLLSRESRESRATAAARFLVLGFGVALGFTVVLAIVMATQLTAACPFCLGLYAASVVGFAAAWMLGPKLREMGSIGEGVQQTFTSRPVISALVVLVAAGVLSQLTYTSFVTRAAEENQQALAQRGQEAAEDLSLHGPIEMDLEGLPRLGPADAPVKIVEFSDFECPYCAIFAQTVHDVHEAFPDEVAIYFSHFPLDSACNPLTRSSLHPSACLAARAALCAQEQDKFWEMHDALFEKFGAAHEAGEHDKPLSEMDLLAFASRMKLQPERFLACVNDDSSSARVAAQVARGAKVGVRSTPTWLINGHLQSGAKPFAYVEPLVEHLLRLHRQEQSQPPAGAATDDAAAPAATNP